MKSLRTARFTKLNLGKSDDRALNKIPPEEALTVYVVYIIRSFLTGYNKTKPGLSPTEWLCQDDNFLVLLPDSNDEFATSLAKLLGLTLWRVPKEEMRSIAEQEIHRIGLVNQNDLVDVQVGHFMPDAPALAFQRAA